MSPAREHKASLRHVPGTLPQFLRLHEGRDEEYLGPGLCWDCVPQASAQKIWRAAEERDRERAHERREAVSPEVDWSDWGPWLPK